MPFFFFDYATTSKQTDLERQTLFQVQQLEFTSLQKELKTGNFKGITRKDRLIIFYPAMQAGMCVARLKISEVGIPVVHKFCFLVSCQILPHEPSVAHKYAFLQLIQILI